MPDVPLRKRLAGSDSYGHTWAEDGAVVEVPYGHAMDLLSIPDGGFSVADQPEDAPAEPEEESAAETEDGGDVAEPDPDPEMAEVAPGPEQPVEQVPGRRTTSRRSTKS